MIVVALGLWYLSTTSVASGYGHVLIALMVLGLGMGTAMTPATESIMGSLPRAKAGVGSAMNDTTRQVGGALGVAILGSVFSSAYATRIASAVAGLPSAAASAARSSVGAALALGSRLSGREGATIVTAARSSFVHAMDRGLVVGAAIALLGSIVALIWLPSWAPDAGAIEFDVRRREGGLETVVERAEQ
jgi:hypothetical protein